MNHLVVSSRLPLKIFRATINIWTLKLDNCLKSNFNKALEATNVVVKWTVVVAQW